MKRLVRRIYWTIRSWYRDSKYPEWRNWNHLRWTWVYFGTFPPPDTFGMRFDYAAAWYVTEDDSDFEGEDDPYAFYYEQG